MSKNESSDDILSALRVLGLMLPITADDVKEAYLAKVRLVHPDTGGDADSFKRVHAAYERALAHAKRYGIRWIGHTVERYISQRRVIEQVKQLGGYAQVESCDWLAREVGDDFAHLFERLVGIRLRGPHVSDGALIRLIEAQHVLGSVRWIDLAASRVTHGGVESLRRLPQLEWLGLEGVALSWWQRLRLRRRFPHAMLAFTPDRRQKVPASVACHTVLRGVLGQ